MNAATASGNGGAANAASPDAREMAIASLLDAGRMITIDVGFEQLRMGEVAKKAGVSRASLYRYFESKEVFIAALLESEMRIFSDCVMLVNESDDGQFCELFTVLLLFLQSNTLFDRALEIESTTLFGETALGYGIRSAAARHFTQHFIDEHEVAAIAQTASRLALMDWLTGHDFSGTDAVMYYAQRHLALPSHVVEVIA